MYLLHVCIQRWGMNHWPTQVKIFVSSLTASKSVRDKPTDLYRPGRQIIYRQVQILHEIIKRKANWIGHILRRNCLLKQVIEGKIKGQKEVTRRRGRRRKKLLDDLKDRRGYCQLKEEALDRTMWRNRFRRGFGPDVWQITDDEVQKAIDTRRSECYT